jgi:hypothetical protein
MNTRWDSQARGLFKRTKDRLIPWRKPVLIGTAGFLVLRLWSSVVLLILNFLPPQVVPTDPNVQNQLINLENSGILSKLFLAPWYRWDSVYYLEMAQNGYSRAFLTVWPPLYSGLVHLVSFLGSAPLVSAIIVSNLSTIIALSLLFRVGDEEYPGSGSQIVKCLVFFPTAFFLVAAYSESLFLCFTMASLWMAHKGRQKWAGLWAALAVLTRLQGALLVIPLLYEGFLHSRQMLRSGNRKVEVWHIVEICLFSALPVVIAVGYAVYVRYGIGAPWPWQTLNSAWGQHTGWPWEGLIGNFTSITGIRQLLTPINPLAQITDLVLVLFSIVCLVGIRISKNPIPVSYQIYAWLCLGLLLMKVDNQGLFVSASRYLLTVFPIFISQADLLRRVNERTMNLVMVTLGLASQAILLICFSWWIWVA